MNQIQLLKSGKQKYPVNNKIFTEETSNSFYLLGAYITDGTIKTTKRRKSFSITSKDRDWLESIRNILCPNKPLYQNGNCYILQIFDIKSLNWLLSYGCVPNKSLTLSLQKDIPDQYKADFIRGVIDGDGCVSLSNYRVVKNNKEYYYTKINCYLLTASESFCNQLQILIPKNIKYSLVKILPGDKRNINGKTCVRRNTLYRIYFTGKYAQQLLRWCYYPGHELSLTRKLNKVHEALTIKIS